MGEKFTFKVVEKPETNEPAPFLIEKIQGMPPSELLNNMIKIQEDLLVEKMKKNTDIKNNDQIDVEENISIVKHFDLKEVNPRQEEFKININNLTVGDFLAEYKRVLEDNMKNLNKDTMYSIYTFNQSMHFVDENSKNSKNESGYTSYITKGGLVS